MRLVDVLGIDWLCKIIDSYASEFKGLLCAVMPAIMDFGKLPDPFFNKGSIAEFDGKIAYNAQFNKLEVIDLQTASKVTSKFGVNHRMVSVNEHLLATYFKGTVSLLDMLTEECLWSTTVGTESDVFDLKLLAPDKLAIFDGLGFVVCEIKSGNQLLAVSVPHLHDVVGLASKLVVAAKGFLHVYDKSELLCTQPAHDAMQLLASSDKRFASGGTDGRIMIWETYPDGLACLCTIEDAKVGCMELLSDGSLAVASADGHHIRVYNGGQLLHDIPYFGWPIFALKALTNNRLASFHMYGDVCIWH